MLTCPILVTITDGTMILMMKEMIFHNVSYVTILNMINKASPGMPT